MQEKIIKIIIVITVILMLLSLFFKFAYNGSYNKKIDMGDLIEEAFNNIANYNNYNLFYELERETIKGDSKEKVWEESNYIYHPDLFYAEGSFYEEEELNEYKMAGYLRDGLVYSELFELDSEFVYMPFLPEKEEDWRIGQILKSIHDMHDFIESYEEVKEKGQKDNINLIKLVLGAGGIDQMIKVLTDDHVQFNQQTYVTIHIDNNTSQIIRFIGSFRLEENETITTWEIDITFTDVNQIKPVDVYNIRNNTDITEDEFDNILEQLRISGLKTDVKRIINDFNLQFALKPFNIENIDINKLSDILNKDLKNDYESIEIVGLSTGIYINAVGKGKWEGLVACGTKNDIVVGDGTECLEPVMPSTEEQLLENYKGPDVEGFQLIDTKLYQNAIVTTYRGNEKYSDFEMITKTKELFTGIVLGNGWVENPPLDYGTSVLIFKNSFTGMELQINVTGETPSGEEKMMINVSYAVILD